MEDNPFPDDIVLRFQAQNLGLTSLKDLIEPNVDVVDALSGYAKLTDIIDKDLRWLSGSRVLCLALEGQILSFLPKDLNEFQQMELIRYPKEYETFKRHRRMAVNWFYMVKTIGSDLCFASNVHMNDIKLMTNTIWFGPVEEYLKELNPTESDSMKLFTKERAAAIEMQMKLKVDQFQFSKVLIARPRDLLEDASSFIDFDLAE